MKQRVIVVGGAGFLGINLVKYLHDQGYQVSILDNFSAGTEVNMSELSIKSNLMIYGMDIRDNNAIMALQGSDIVVHLAAFTRVVESITNPSECFSVNVIGTLNLLEASRKLGIKKFIFASSNAVMGNQPPPFNESLQPVPISPMGLSKLVAEQLCDMYSKAYGLNTVVLRFSNCYGKYSRHKGSVIHKYIRQMLRNESLTIFGDGFQSRDFVYAEDICRAIELCFNNNDANGQIFHIGSGVETTLNSLVKSLRAITGANMGIVFKPPQQGEITRNYSDITKARFAFEYIPQVSLEKGLKETWEWYKNG